MYCRISFAILLFLSCCAAIADGAALFIHPQSLFLQNTSRSEEVLIANRGNRTGVFEVMWVDNVMSERGELREWLEANVSPYSLQPHIRYSPRRVTLKPGESQVVRLALKKTAKDAPPGEYYSHLKIRTLNDNLEASLTSLSVEDSPLPSDQPKKNLSIAAKVGLAIPVIWRHGIKPPNASIQLQAHNKERGEITLNITRHGLASTRGYLHVLHEEAGDRKPVMAPVPFIIYPNIETRQAVLKVEMPVSVSGQYLVIYTEKHDDLNNVIATSTVTL